MNCQEVPTLTDIPDLPSRGRYEPDAETYEALTFSPEDDAKLARAAQRGPTAVSMALAGDPAGLEEMRRLHVVRWEVMR